MPVRRPRRAPTRALPAPRRLQPPARAVASPALTPTLTLALTPALALALILTLALGGCASSTPDMVEPTPSPTDLPLAEHQLYDRVVAVVDEEAILLSDIEEVLGLGLVDPEPGAPEGETRARVLDGLIDHQLRYRAAERFGVGRVSVDRIEEQVEAIRSGFPDRNAFDERLRELGLTETELRQLVARQLLVLRYVDERLGAQVFVALEDIRAYYEESLVPELQAAGQPVPPLEEVREEIRAVIRQQRLLEEVDRWTAELRREADVQWFLDQPLESLPPLLLRIGETGG